MSARLILAIFSTLLEETALVVIVLWGLPRLGVRIPVAGLVSLMVAWAILSISMYRIGSKALRRPVDGLPSIIGLAGKAASTLDPDGMIKIRGELWVGKSPGGR